MLELPLVAIQLKNGNGSYVIEKNRLKELKEIVECLLQIKEKSNHLLNSKWYFKRIIDFSMNGFVPNCQAGKLTLHVTPDGYVKPCPDLPVVSYFSDYKVRDFKGVSCESCWYACRGEAESPMTFSRILELKRSQRLFQNI